MGVLSSMLQDLQCIPHVVEKITEEYFYIPAHQEIYKVLVELWGKGGEIDLIIFTQVLRDRNLEKTVGGAAKITEIYTFVPTSANVAYYLEIIREKYLLRQMIATCTEAVRRSYEEQDEVNALIDSIQVKVMGIRLDEWKPKKTLADHVMDKIDRMQNGEPNEDVIKTKITKLDEISPLRNGDMPLITGERKDGKSILALSVLENICISQKRPGIIFSLEDRIPKVMDRIFAGVSRIPASRHHVKNMSEEEIEASKKAADKIRSANIIIYDDTFELSSIMAKLHKAYAEFPDLAIAMIDYAQLVISPSKKGATREQEVATVSRAFRIFGMETGVPVVLLSQLNSSGVTRESKALEQDATANWRVKQVKGTDRERWIEIPWQRNGPSGEVFKVGFFGEIARVENLSRAPEFVHPRNS